MEEQSNTLNTLLLAETPSRQSSISSSSETDPHDVPLLNSNGAEYLIPEIENNIEHSTKSTSRQSLTSVSSKSSKSCDALQSNSPVDSVRTHEIENNHTGSSIMISSQSRQLSFASNEMRLNSLRNLKLFPIFGDENIAKVSINYFLYLEFFRIAIKVFCFMFIISTIWYIITLIANDAIESSPMTVLYVYEGFAIAVGILLKALFMYEQRRLLENPILHNFQWTQDLFSALVEGLPQETNGEEIKDHFNAVLGDEGYVKEVILLQDSYTHAKIKNEMQCIKDKIDNLERKMNKTEQNEKDKSELLLKLELKNKLFDKTEQELLLNGHFRGKAIIIFNTIQAKHITIKHFKVSIWLRPWKYCFNYFNCFFEEYRFKGNMLSVSEISEPEDFIFPNIHATRRNFFKIIFAYLGSLLVIAISMGGLVYLKGHQLMGEDGYIADYANSYIFSIGVIALSFVLDGVYRYLNTFFTYRSSIKAQINTLNYGIFTSFILYILLQVISAFSGPEIWVRQLILVLVLYFGKILLIKGFTLLWTTTTIKNVNASLTNSLLSNITQRMQKRYVEFDFIAGIRLVVPLILMPFTFLLLNPIALLGIPIICLYGCAIIDKYRMLKCCNLFKVRSSAFTMKTFRMFKWDMPCLLWGSLLVVQSLWENLENPNEYEDTILLWFVTFCIIVFALICVCLSKSLKARFKRKFIDRNAKVEYDSVCEDFTATYQEKDPVRQIMATSYMHKSKFIIL